MLAAIAAGLLALVNASAPPTLEKSVAILYSQAADGGMITKCSATAIDRIGGETHFLTAAHCVVEADEKTGKSKITEAPLFLSTDEVDTKTYVRAKIVEVGVRERGYDYAFLSAPLNIPTVPLGDERNEADHVRLHNVAAPNGLGKVFSYGHVALKVIDRPIVDQESRIQWSGAMLVNVEVEGGSSGSAIVSTDTGRIVGILVGHYGTLAIAVPASRLATKDPKNILYPEPKGTLAK